MSVQLLSRDQELRLALNARQAAAAMGISIAHFKRHVQPEVHCVYSGRARVYRVAELERWLRDNEGPTVQDRRRAA